MKNYKRRNHNTVSFSLSGIAYTAVMAIIATLTDMGYNVNIRDLHTYDDEVELYSITFDLRLMSRYCMFGTSSDWHRMKQAATEIYSITKEDLQSRHYDSCSICIDFFRESDGELFHHYTVYTVDYSMGCDGEFVRYVRLR